MKIIHLTDLHFVDPGSRLFGLDPAERLAQCFDSILQNHADGDLCVITGDLTEAGSSAAYRFLRSALTSMPIPCRLLLGNHDDRQSFRQVFHDHPIDDDGFVQSVLDTPEGRLIFLDTLDPGRGTGRLCDRRLAWLEARLTEAGHVPVTVFMHHPPASIGVRHFETLRLVDPEPFLALLHAHGKVRSLLFGHVHLSVTGTIEGIPFATNRGTCHHIVLEMHRDGRATFAAAAPSYGVVLMQHRSMIVHSCDLLETLPVIRPAQAGTQAVVAG